MLGCSTGTVDGKGGEHKNLSQAVGCATKLGFSTNVAVGVYTAVGCATLLTLYTRTTNGDYNGVHCAGCATKLYFSTGTVVGDGCVSHIGEHKGSAVFSTRTVDGGGSVPHTGEDFFHITAGILSNFRTATVGSLPHLFHCVARVDKLNLFTGTDDCDRSVPYTGDGSGPYTDYCDGSGSHTGDEHFFHFPAGILSNFHTGTVGGLSHFFHCFAFFVGWLNFFTGTVGGHECSYERKVSVSGGHWNRSTAPSLCK